MVKGAKIGLNLRMLFGTGVLDVGIYESVFVLYHSFRF